MYLVLMVIALKEIQDLLSLNLLLVHRQSQLNVQMASVKEKLAQMEIVKLKFLKNNLRDLFQTVTDQTQFRASMEFVFLRHVLMVSVL